jgi:Zn-dependent oligopeptidase
LQSLLKFAKTKSDNIFIKNEFDRWDISYYIREYNELECNIDLNEIRKYFPFRKVVEGLCIICEKMFGLVIQKIETDNVWHDCVELYAVFDDASREILGYFYLDLYQREGKYANSTTVDFQSGCDLTKILEEDIRLPHVVIIGCNFPLDDYMDFSNVILLFHEFGHAMHQICSRSSLQEFSALKIDRDFVETPSQLFEYFAYKTECLELISVHPQPDKLREKLVANKNSMVSFYLKRQISFGLGDLALHMLNNDTYNIQKIWYDATDLAYPTKIRLHTFASVGHLVNGYDVGYYGYLLSATYAAHIYYRMFNDEINILKSNVGRMYRKKLLEAGSRIDAMDLLVEFLGEKPDMMYFLREFGLNS